MVWGGCCFHGEEELDGTAMPESQCRGLVTNKPEAVLARAVKYHQALNHVCVHLAFIIGSSVIDPSL